MAEYANGAKDVVAPPPHSMPQTTEHADQDRAPSPHTVAVWRVLEMLAVERTPWWAAQWLADGHDGEALRELAGLNGKDSRAARSAASGPYRNGRRTVAHDPGSGHRMLLRPR